MTDNQIKLVNGAAAIDTDAAELERLTQSFLVATLGQQVQRSGVDLREDDLVLQTGEFTDFHINLSFVE